MEKRSAQLSIRMTEKERKKLKRLAKQQKRTEGDVIRLLIEAAK